MNEINENNNTRRFVAEPGEYKFKINGETENISEVIEKRRLQEISEGLEKYMPIGSVVNCGNTDKIYMIIGFRYKTNGSEYDYLGCLYPYGIQNNESFICFNHNEIEKVYNIGYINNLERNFKNQLLNSNSKHV